MRAENAPSRSPAVLLAVCDPRSCMRPAPYSMQMCKSLALAARRFVATHLCANRVSKSPAPIIKGSSCSDMFAEWQRDIQTSSATCQHVILLQFACRVAARDSGKPLVDAAFGELMVTCEKAQWLINNGARHLRPEWRSPGRMVRRCTL